MAESYWSNTEKAIEQLTNIYKELVEDIYIMHKICRTSEDYYCIEDPVFISSCENIYNCSHKIESKLMLLKEKIIILENELTTGPILPPLHF